MLAIYTLYKKIIQTFKKHIVVFIRINRIFYTYVDNNHPFENIFCIYQTQFSTILKIYLANFPLSAGVLEKERTKQRD